MVTTKLVPWLSMEADIQYVHQSIESLFRQEAGRVRATLLSSLRDFEMVEDVMQEAFIMALERWPVTGLPEHPSAWLLTTARNKAIDRLRRMTTLARKREQLQWLANLEQQSSAVASTETFPDDRLKLIFTCCHPALNLEARIALTLHTLGGLTTSEIASAFLVPEATMAQRLVRAKRKIRDAGIPHKVPSLSQLAERLDGVLAILYLIFNAGYTAPTGDTLVRFDLCTEAIRLARALAVLVTEMLGEEPEVTGLLALMLLHDSRRPARINAQGELIVLEEQDRALWDHVKIEEGTTLLERGLALHRPGSYQIQAAISALHAEAESAYKTDWLQIALLYEALAKINSSVIVKLNWIVALAMARTPAYGLEALAKLNVDKGLQHYHLFHAARADLLRRTGDFRAAHEAYQQALALTHNTVEQAFLRRRIKEMHASIYALS